MNQDWCFTSESPVGDLPNLFIVADGMGGHKAGEYASRHTVDIVVETVKQLHGEPAEILKEAIRTANEDLRRQAAEDESMKGMGTTIVAAFISGDRLCVANVGDSRLYIVNDHMIQVTQDHSLVEEMVRMGELDRETARKHPDRNIITRAVGAAGRIDIDIFETNITAKDEILLCSDGLTNMLEDEEIRRIIKGQRDTAEKAERLVERANAKGGKDNITVVVIDPFSDEVKG